jgi:hypothetical protein
MDDPDIIIDVLFWALSAVPPIVLYDGLSVVVCSDREARCN